MGSRNVAAGHDESQSAVLDAVTPAVRDIASGSITDWTRLVANAHGKLPTTWVFASTRRKGRDPDNEDVSVYPNSLNKHLIRCEKRTRWTTSPTSACTWCAA